MDKLTKNQIRYKNVRSYKYELVEGYIVDVFGVALPGAIDTEFITLTSGGILAIRAGYAWDGPSGPTFDTKSFMRGSLVHDALYQLMRLELLSSDYRDDADRLLRKMCREDGMNRLRAFFVYRAVRRFASSAANPKNVYVPVVEVAP